MSINNSADPDMSDRSDWSHAWNAVSRLASIRGAALDEILPLEEKVTLKALDAERPTSDAAPQLPATASEAVVRGTADIEKAIATLQRHEPALKRSYPNVAPELKAPGPVWMLLTSMWICAALVACGAIGTIGLLFGG